jgi:hypothetical protein
MDSAYAPRNAWQNATLPDLEVACSRYAGVLAHVRALDADARRRLGDDIRTLLIAIALRIATHPTVPDSPEQAMANAADPDVAIVFGRWQRARETAAIRGARMEALQRAASFVFGRDAARWLDPGEGPLHRRPVYRGVDSAEGLDACLRELHAAWRARAHAGR